jgi:hypothetical protein
MSDKPILLICGCAKYEEYLHAAIRRFSRPAWTTIGFKGGAEETTFNEETRILTLAVPDIYDALPTKIHAAFSWASARWPDAPGFFKTDDDILLQDMNHLVFAVNTFKGEAYWGLTTHRCSQAPVNPYRVQTLFTNKQLIPIHQSAHYCFGAGYWISKAAIPFIVAAKDTYAASYLEDVCTGYVLNSAGIEPVQHKIPWAEGPRISELLKHQ